MVNYHVLLRRETNLGMLSQLISMASRAMSGRGGSQTGTGGQGATGKSRMMQRVGSEAIKQVQKAGPDAAQRHLSKTKFGTDPRAQKAAKAADDLARRFAGSESGNQIKAPARRTPDDDPTQGGPGNR